MIYVEESALATAGLAGLKSTGQAGRLEDSLQLESKGSLEAEFLPFPGPQSFSLKAFR